MKEVIIRFMFSLMAASTIIIAMCLLFGLVDGNLMYEIMGW